MIYKMTSYGTLVNSLNLYIDSSDKIHNGDDINLQLQGQALHCSDGQNFKVVLTEFNMQRSTYTIDSSNNIFNIKQHLTGQANPGNIEDITITAKNYKTVEDIASEFSLQLSTAIGAQQGGTNIATPATITSPLTDEDPSKNGTMLLDVTLNFSSAHGLQDLIIQFDENVSDAYILLGGDRVDPNTNNNSLDATILNTTSIRVQGRYPMQLTSLPHLYVRTDLHNTAIQSSSLNGTGSSTHTISSNILAKIPMSFSQINYAAPGIDEFFMYLPQRTISSLRLTLTDHKNRALGRVGNNQGKTGPLFFTATIRVDVIQRTPPNTLKSTPIPRSIPGSKLGPGFLRDELMLE